MYHDALSAAYRDILGNDQNVHGAGDGCRY
jgi:hypothetical protein